MIGVVSGIAISVAISIANHSARVPKDISVYAGICCVLFTVLLFWRIRSLYDFLGFTKDPTTKDELDAYERNNNRRSRRAKYVRKILEVFIHIFLSIQVVSLVIAYGTK